MFDFDMESEEQYINMFDAFYDKKTDLSKMKSIIEKIKQYDVYDFIAKAASLNLLRDNQNKNILLSSLIGAVLSLKDEETTSKYVMSSGKFKNIIRELESLQLSIAIDPAENPFVERVMMYENYYVFTGINHCPSYNLQSLIRVIFLRDSFLPIEYKHKIARYLQLILNLSDRIARKLNIDINSLKHTSESRSIEVPDKKMLEKLKNLVTVEETAIKLLINEDWEIYESLFSQLGEVNIEKGFERDTQPFFAKPFIKNREGKVIVLDITVLASYVMHRSIILAEKYGCKEELLKELLEVKWEQCKQDLAKLGHHKIKEELLEIELYNNDSYKEVILSAGNNQFLVAIVISDDGEAYTETSMFSSYPSGEKSGFVEKRLEYLHEKINKFLDSEEDIFLCVIMDSFGRGIRLGLNKKIFCNSIVINPFELHCIAVNNSNDSFFLPRYMRAKNKVKFSVPLSMIGELNCIEIYTSNDLSFYLDDDYKMSETSLFIAPGDSVDYIIRALQKEDLQLVDSYDDKYKCEVVKNEDKIYCDISITKEIRPHLLVKFENLNIWVYSEIIDRQEEMNVYFSLVDAITYWFKQCKCIFESNEFEYKTIKVQIKLKENEEKNYLEVETVKNISDVIEIHRTENLIIVNICPDVLNALNCENNKREKELIYCLLQVIGETAFEGFNFNKLDDIFLIPQKKKFIFLDYQNYPYLKPFNVNGFRKISIADENELLDQIGQMVLESGKWTYGIIPDNERGTIANFVVGELYKKLEQIISTLNPEGIIEQIYIDQERILYNLMISQRKYAYDIACYPNQKNKLFNKFNELNKSSVSLKFLMEYVSARPPRGNKILGEYQYEKLIAICSLIINWAYKNDLFRYQIYSTPVEVLKSGRIGMKQKEFVFTEQVAEKARSTQLEYNSLSSDRTESNFSINRNYDAEIDEAFLDEYQFSFNDLCKVVWALIAIGDDQNSEVKKGDKDVICKRVLDISQDITISKFEMIIDRISLNERENFLVPPKGFRKEEVYPWRFNRELSFTRRPIIVRNNEFIWGNRYLYHMLPFWIDMIYEGKIKTQKQNSKMDKLRGKISKERGKVFNEKIVYIIRNYGIFQIQENVSKVNGNKIVDENGNELGDIDIIAISKETKSIILIETKDFNMSKNPYEIYFEHKEMFEDSEKKRCFTTKHRRRQEWIENHIKDVLLHFNLDNDDWKVRRTFIVNEHLVSAEIYRKKENIIALPELTAERLLRC